MENEKLPPAEPYRIKSVESIRLLDRAARDAALQQAGLNVFNLHSDDVYIDLLTDSGTGAMSDRQWAAMMLGDESYAGARSWYRFESTVRALTGYPHVIPVHQGRVAEHLLFGVVLRGADGAHAGAGDDRTTRAQRRAARTDEARGPGAGLFVPSNTHFDTTRANVEATGATALDFPVAEARVPSVEHPFKGNCDLEQCRQLVERVGAKRIPLAMLTLTNNSGGGQPVSLANVRAVCDFWHAHNIPVILDACRFAENAWFIAQREPGQQGRPVRDIAHDLFAAADGCTMSAKKDGLANIGGFLALRDGKWAREVTQRLVLVEGFRTYGGLAGRDLEAIAAGLEEVTDERYLAHRVGQVAWLGERLVRAEVPIIRPTGGHAVYVDARALLPHIPPDGFPGQALVVALYREAGVRAVEVGSFMFGKRDPVSGEHVAPPLELVRLAIPRRVYTASHLGYVADALIRIAARRSSLRPLRIVSPPTPLRHFTAVLEEI